MGAGEAQGGVGNHPADDTGRTNNENHCFCCIGSVKNIVWNGALQERSIPLVISFSSFCRGRHYLYCSLEAKGGWINELPFLVNLRPKQPAIYNCAIHHYVASQSIQCAIQASYE
jgi:hypothetical protein